MSLSVNTQFYPALLINVADVSASTQDNTSLLGLAATREPISVNTLLSPPECRLRTVKILTPQNRAILEDVAQEWLDIAFDQWSAPLVQESFPEERINLIMDATAVISVFIERLRQGNLLEIPYIAYDEAHTIQAMALMNFSEQEEDPELTCIVTHPHNIPLDPMQKRPCRGAGTALMTHIVSDISHQRSFVLSACPSATPFYANLGFEQTTDASIAQNGYIPMVLTVEKIQRLLQSHSMKSERIAEQDIHQEVMKQERYNRHTALTTQKMELGRRFMERVEKYCHSLTVPHEGGQ